MFVKLHKFTDILLLIAIATSVTVVNGETEIATNSTVTTYPILNKSEEVTTNKGLEVVSINNGRNGNKLGCVPFYKCDPRTRMLKKRNDNVTNISGCSESEKCEGRYDVCCQIASNNPAMTKLNPENENEPIPANKSCVCVLYYLCSDDGYVDSNKDVHLFSRRRRSPQDGVCKSSNDVCCEFDDKSNAFPANWKGCGHRNPNGVPLASPQQPSEDDTTSKFGEFPWMVAVLRKDMEKNGTNINAFQCGGALIHPQVAVTTAHCITDTDKALIIRAGEWDVTNKKEQYPHQDRKVSTITIHPQFKDGVLNNDIALLFLKNPVTIAETVDPICLPPQNAVFDNTRCLVSGWGKDRYGLRGKYQQILKKVNLPIVANGACQEALRTTRLGVYFQLHRSFICAGGEADKDTCKGDGGSPLVCPIAGLENRYVLAGMVSWGISCGGVGIPGVYTNVALYRNWIDQEMASNNFDWKSYQY